MRLWRRRASSARHQQKFESLGNRRGARRTPAQTIRRNGSHGEPPPEKSFAPEETCPRRCATQQISPSTQPRPAHFFPDVSDSDSALAFEIAPGTPQFRLTTCRRLLHPRRRCVLDLAHPTTRCVLSFLPRASSKTAPLWSAALLRAVPSRCEKDTIVVSTAICAPSNMVYPTTTISNRLASTGLTPSMSRFLTMTFVDTLDHFFNTHC